MVRWMLLVAILLAGCTGGASFEGAGSQGASLPAVEDARRLEILEQVRVFRAGQDGTNSDAELEALALFLEALPEIEGAAVSADGSVWAVFTDGRLLVVADNRPRGLQAAREDAWSAATELPAAAEAHLVNAFETASGCYASPADVVGGALASRGYTVSEGAGVTELRGLGTPLGLLYVDSHGAVLNMTPGGGGTRGVRVIGPPPPPEFGLWTSTDVSASGERLFRGDLDARRLVYYEAATNQPGGSCTQEVHYAVTGAFVRRYLQFSEDSLVFVNACQSDSALLKEAFLAQGASAYAGWTDNVSDDLAFEVARTLFPMMLGDDSVPGVDLPDAIADLQDQGLDRDVGTGAQLVFTTVPVEFGQLVPILESVRATDGRLTLRGKFGSTAGRILIDGNPEPRLGAWDPLFLQCAIPEGSQFVAVEVRGHRSNRLPVTGGDAPRPPRGGVGALGGYWEGTGHEVPENTGELKVSFLFEVGETSNGGQSAEITGRLQVGLQLFSPENGTQFAGTVGVSDDDPFTLSFTLSPVNDPTRVFTGEMTANTLTGSFTPPISVGAEKFVFTCTPGTPPDPED